MHGRYSQDTKELPQITSTLFESMTKNFEILKQECINFNKNVTLCFDSIKKMRNSCSEITSQFQEYGKNIPEEIVQTEETSESLNLLQEKIDDWKNQLKGILKMTVPLTEVLNYTVVGSKYFSDFIQRRKAEEKWYFESQEKFHKKKYDLFLEGFSNKWEINRLIKDNVLIGDIEKDVSVGMVVILPKVKYFFCLFSYLFLRRIKR